ncbi:hypothetical protein [Allosphingosinicella sp.]|jgi:hypothetical protein|uniref:hypothetical protein n=1 Tax=Allosphingosinicella sp. TaxID=2823234 RepID=UPI002F18D531
MHDNREAMMVVRAELCDRFDRLRARSDRMSGADFRSGVEGIRMLASVYGLAPVARLAEALHSAAASDRPGSSPVGLYMERLRDSIGCERVDEEASQAMLASISVRLSA